MELGDKCSSLPLYFTELAQTMKITLVTAEGVHL